MPLSFWWDAFQTLVFLINRLPTTILKNKSPYQVLYNRVRDYSFIKIFCCACFPNLRPYNSHKLNFRTDKCVFLEYNSSHKGYKCLHKSRRIYIAHHVIFNENDFPFLRGEFLDSTKLCPTINQIPVSQFLLTGYNGPIGQDKDMFFLVPQVAETTSKSIQCNTNGSSHTIASQDDNTLSHANHNTNTLAS